jgi:hypothetical protein
MSTVTVPASPMSEARAPLPPSGLVGDVDVPHPAGVDRIPSGPIVEKAVNAAVVPGDVGRLPEAMQAHPPSSGDEGMPHRRNNPGTASLDYFCDLGGEGGNQPLRKGARRGSGVGYSAFRLRPVGRGLREPARALAGLRTGRTPGGNRGRAGPEDVAVGMEAAGLEVPSFGRAGEEGEQSRRQNEHSHLIRLSKLLREALFSVERPATTRIDFSTRP